MKRLCSPCPPSPTCNPGEVATGGGFYGDSSTAYFTNVIGSSPGPSYPANSTPTEWDVVVRGGSTVTQGTAYVICIPSP